MKRPLRFQSSESGSEQEWLSVWRVPCQLKVTCVKLEDTLRGDEKSVAEGLDRVHTEEASILTYNDENSMGCAIGLAYYSARKDYRLIRELPAGKGFADVVFLPLPSTKKPALEGYTGEILLVVISYDREDKEKPHSCVIERFIK